MFNLVLCRSVILGVFVLKWRVFSVWLLGRGRVRCFIGGSGMLRVLVCVGR